MEEKDTESDFGKGFIYSLILFAKHHDRIRGLLDTFKRTSTPQGLLDRESMAFELWVNGAADHMFDMEIPEKYQGTEIGNKAEYLREFVLNRRLPFGNADKFTEKEFYEVFDMLEELAMLIDKDMGLEPIKANNN